MNIVEKAERCFLLLKFAIRLSKSNKERVKDMQVKKGFTKGRITRIHFMDFNKHYDLCVENGVVTPAHFGKPVVFVYIKDFCVLKHMRLGKKLGKDPASGGMCEMSYSLMNAWASGDVSTHGEASTNDMLAFLDIFMDVMSMIPEDEMMKLVGPCDHDVPQSQSAQAAGNYEGGKTEIRSKTMAPETQPSK